MAELTTEKRKELPKSTFIFPAEEAYPIPDEKHGSSALAAAKGARSGKRETPERAKKIYRAVCNKFPGLPACELGFQKWWEGKEGE